MPMLTQKALLLAKVETSADVDAAPAAAVDAIMVAEPNYSIDPTVLERNYARNDFSQYASYVGRKLAKMSFSLQATPSGVADTAPRWAALLEGCGFSKALYNPTPKTLSAAPTGASRAGTGIVTFTTTAAHGLSVGENVNVSGVTDATFNGDFVVLSVPTSTTFTVQQTSTTVATSGTGTVQSFTGQKYTPLTDNAKTLTLYLYLDGQLHKMTGAMGNVSLQGEAGNFMTLSFEFTGTYYVPTAVVMPTPTYEDVIPPQMENMAFTFDGNTQLVVQSLSLDMQNNVVPRSDVNAGNGYRGVRLTGRNPTGGFNPESEVTQDFWSRLTGSTLGFLSARVGSAAGGRIVIGAPKVQISNVAYGDRDGLRTYDLSVAFRRNAGNDEVSFLFD